MVLSFLARRLVPHSASRSNPASFQGQDFSEPSTPRDHDNRERDSDMTTTWGMSNHFDFGNEFKAGESSSSAHKTIAGGNFARAGPVSYSAAVAAPRTPGPAQPQHPALAGDTPTPHHSPMVEAHNPPQAHPVDVDLEFLEQKVETFVTKLSNKLVKQAKELLPAALETAVRHKVKSMEKQYQKEVEQEREQAAAHAKKLTEAFEQQLQFKDQDLACIKQELSSSEQHCTCLEDALATVERERTEIQAQLATKTKELQTLNLAMDELQFELDGVKCKGSELLTFQGLTTSKANLNTLKVALKDLDTLCQGFTTLVWENGLAHSLIPEVVDWRHMAHSNQRRQLGSSCIQHAVLSELSDAVFGHFRKTELTASCCNSITSCAPDPEAVLLQLQLEAKTADNWLKVATELGAVAPEHVETLVNQYAGRFLKQLLSKQNRLRWDIQRNPVALLGTAAKRLVGAALKAQIIASSMHSQLIRIVVPGYLQDTGLSTKPTAPAAWQADWPGVVPLSRDWMQPGVALVASAGAVPAGTEPAAVFCQEPGVVQLAERVGDLPEFGGKGAGQGVYKVLVKARMAVAR